MLSRRGFFGAVTAAAVAPMVAPARHVIGVDPGVDMGAAAYVFRRGDYQGESDHVLDSEVYVFRCGSYPVFTDERLDP